MNLGNMETRKEVVPCVKEPIFTNPVIMEVQPGATSMALIRFNNGNSFISPYTPTNENVQVEPSAETFGKIWQAFPVDHNYSKVPEVKIYKVYPESVYVEVEASAAVEYQSSKGILEQSFDLTASNLEVSEQNDGLTSEVKIYKVYPESVNVEVEASAAVEYQSSKGILEQSFDLTASNLEVSEENSCLTVSSQQVSEQNTTCNMTTSSQGFSEQNDGLTMSSQQISEQNKEWTISSHQVSRLNYDFTPSGQQVCEENNALIVSNQQVPEQVNDLTSREKTVKNSSSGSCSKKSEKPFTCLICSKAFRSRQALYMHRVKKHPEKKSLFARKASIVCQDCADFQGTSLKEFVLHQAEQHHKDVRIESQKFVSEAEFQAWKSNVEKETYSKYKNQSHMKTKSAVLTYYFCHRSGKPNTVNTRTRKPKRQGTCKTGVKCTAYMIAKTDLKDKTVNVEYCINHIGHDFDLAHLQISEEVRKSVARQLSEGVDPYDIIDAIRNSSSAVNRDSFLTLKDINNIKKQFNISMPTFKKKVQENILYLFKQQAVAIFFQFDALKGDEVQLQAENRTSDVLIISPEC
ncbi:hypothetical protein EGW08_018948 [Elysia chlorotica]|uniref:C2H2-type domain-containing protein n=1 Tax=Elysia chlorotica TaxID=188477 RepID=A0A3S1B0P6_ELYCH|nr:hypothetical protein EGW08_018948 [Elysia chlorotica]